MAYTKFTGWANTTLPIKMRNALANIEDGVEQGINAAAAAQAAADAALPKSGGTMSGAINMGTKQITNMADPTAAQHAATKAYVDAGDTTNANAAAAAKAAADAAAATANAALPKAGGTMSGAINMGSKQITHLAAPTADAHAANKKYVDDAAAGVAAQLGSYLPTAGGAMSGPIDMNSNKITEVPTPQADTDAANKKYVDDTVSPVSTVADSAASTASAANTAAANAQTAINNHKADTAVHVAFTTTTPKMDGTASVGSANTVARSDHKHPTDTSRAAQADLNNHVNNDDIHFTADERTKLAGIATGANKYSHPVHTAKTAGLYKITVDSQGHVTGANAVVKSDITALGIPSTNTTYDNATSSANGLMPSTDKAKLDGMEIATVSEVETYLGI